MGIKSDSDIGLARPGTLQRSLTRSGTAALVGLGLVFGASQSAWATALPTDLAISAIMQVVIKAGDDPATINGDIELLTGLGNATSTMLTYTEGDAPGLVGPGAALTHVGNSVSNSGDATSTGASNNDDNDFRVDVYTDLTITNSSVADDYIVTVRLDFDHSVSSSGTDASIVSDQVWERDGGGVFENPHIDADAALGPPDDEGMEDGFFTRDILVGANNSVMFFSEYFVDGKIPTGTSTANNWNMLLTIVSTTNVTTGAMVVVPPPSTGVSEPATLLLLGGSLLGIGWTRRRKLAKVA